jgi:hypothetical protein
MSFQPLSTLLSRRSALLGLLTFGYIAITHAKPNPIAITVWKDPTCGCCKDWITHLEANGFKATVFNEGRQAMRAQLGMPASLGSCHTAQVQGYVIEGHVPASDIQRLLQQKPKALGLAVPGMPIGSPGMDGPAYGGRRDAYEVLLVNRGGSTAVFNRYAKS